jgi:hypothetical protein
VFVEELLRRPMVACMEKEGVQERKCYYKKNRLSRQIT